MNEIIVKLYEEFFDWSTYQGLLNMVFNNHDYGKIGWLILIIPIIILIIFYKFWDPISASTVLYNNTKIIQYLGNYTGGNGQPDADYFIIQMSLMTLVYSLIIAFILSIIPFRLISSNNRNNPF